MGDDPKTEEAAVARPGFGRSVAIGAALGLVFLVCAGAAWFWWETEGSWRDHPIVGVETHVDGLDLVLWVGCVEGELRASASEHADRVVVTVEGRGDHSEADCMVGASVTLSEPIGDRFLIDGNTGTRLEPTSG